MPVAKANPQPAQNLRAREFIGLLAPVAALTSVAAVVAAVLAPADALQGQWQRLMYLHVPLAWLAYLCFTLVLGAGLAHLRHPSGASTRWGRAAAEVGVASTATTLAVGSLWGRGVWGVWWTWDARLVSTAVMLMVYVGYLGLHHLSGDPVAVARRAAVVGCAGFVVVPVVHFSVTWWTTLHQQATLLGPPTSAPPIDPRMALALLLSVLAVTSVGLAVLLWRVDLLTRRARRRPAAVLSDADTMTRAPLPRVRADDPRSDVVDLR